MWIELFRFVNTRLTANIWTIAANLLPRYFVDKAPFPVLTGLERPDDGMFGRMEVLRGVFVGRRIAAANVAAFQALPQVHPLGPDLEAIFATLRTGFDISDLIEMSTDWHGR